jgi:pyruvate/2-oxoglutarate dehydrogenase complex dihydrolipoamide dehydrogenase (E3) component
MTIIKKDLCIIGAGSAGLSLAAVSVQMGLSVALIEKDKMGGECLHTGCIPSKSLLASAKAAHFIKNISSLGITTNQPSLDFKKVHEHLQNVIKKIAPHDSIKRFESLGVQVIKGTASFISLDAVKVNDDVIKAKRFVIATGSIPLIPPLSGLESCPYLTNETLFHLKKCPQHLLIIGGGPIGVEMAQAFCRLGAKVSLIQSRWILPHDDAESTRALKRSLENEGVKIYELSKIISVKKEKNSITLTLQQNKKTTILKGSHLLVAAGRKPNLHHLDLEKAGVSWTSKGISVNQSLRTTNPRIYAIGDVLEAPHFTHVSNYHAGIVLKNILFKWPFKVDYRALPWVTYTDPELAHVGLTEQQADEKKIKINTLKGFFKGNDRAQTEENTQGFIKIIVSKKGQILGVTILGPHAGELISLWGLAIQKNLKINAIAELIVPYPTFSELSKRTAGNFFTPFLFGQRMKKIVRILMWFS